MGTFIITFRISEHLIARDIGAGSSSGLRRAVNADLRRIVENFLVCVDIRPWTSASAQRYGPLRAELEALGKSLAPMDLLIATHALAEDCTLVSADRVFAQVPGLRVLDWSASSNK